MHYSPFIIALSLAGSALGAAPAGLKESLRFHASFDKTADADFARGDGRAYTAPTLQREKPKPGLHRAAVHLMQKGGRYGGAETPRKKIKKYV